MMMRKTVVSIARPVCALTFSMIVLFGGAQLGQAQWTETTDINNTNSGNVGVGTTSPATKLDVSGTTRITSQTVPTGGAGAEIEYIGAANLATIRGYDRTSSSYKALSLNDNVTVIGGTSGNVTMATAGGNVGIGTTSPSYKLDVNGATNSNSTITGNNIIAKYQDVAEWVPSSEQLSAGTVVVLDSTKANQVTSSSVSYDSRVAGVVSEQPGIALGEKSDGKVLVATTGRVRVKVDATKGPIHIGDLLVTSDVPGVAMKSKPVNLGGVQIHRPGTLIRKALEPLEKGKGEILALLSLQ